MLSAMALTGPPLPADVLDTLYPLAEGNPFFIEELLSTSLTTAQARMQEKSAEQFAFRHALTRQAIYEGLSLFCQVGVE